MLEDYHTVAKRRTAAEESEYPRVRLRLRTRRRKLCEWNMLSVWDEADSS